MSPEPVGSTHLRFGDARVVMGNSMRLTESCSESRMRSRTSRGVPEWSGGKDLYIGSPVSATGRVSGVTGIVPGPPEGSRGSTRWGHLSRRAPWAEVGKGTSPWWDGAPPLGLPLCLGLETLGVGGAPPDLGGKSPPPWPTPHLRLDI